MSDHRIALRVLAAAVVVIVASSGVARGIGWLCADVGQAPHGVRRLRLMVDDLPTIATSPQPTVLLIGSSVTAWGLDPEIVGTELHEAATFNLGIAAMFPREHAQLVHRVASEYGQRGQRAAAIVLEASPAALSTGDNPLRQSLFTLALASRHELLDRLWSEEGLRLLGRRYLFGGFAGPEITFRLRGALENDVPRWFGDLTEDQREAELQPPLIAWSLERHGSPLDPATTDRYTTWLAAVRAHGSESRAVRRKQANEGIVVALITAAKEARTITDHVILWVPTTNSCLPPYEVENAERILARIERESGATLFRPNPQLGCDDFEDSVHVTRTTGVTKQSESFGRELAGLLQNWK